MATDEAIKAAIAAMPPQTDTRPESVVLCEHLATAADTILRLKKEGRPLEHAVRYADDVWSYDDPKEYVLVSGLVLVIFRNSAINDKTAAAALARVACANEP